MKCSSSPLAESRSTGTRRTCGSCAPTCSWAFARRRALPRDRRIGLSGPVPRRSLGRHARPGRPTRRRRSREARPRVRVGRLFAATFGAACETGLSVGYSVAQYFGWQWGKYVRPREAARFHVVLLLAAITGVAVLLTTVDPIKVTEYSVVFSAVALPLTYFPILVVANDADYMGRQSQRRANRSLEAVRRGLDHRRAYGERRASVEHLDCGGELRAARHL
jgi:hypothetical protein